MITKQVEIMLTLKDIEEGILNSCDPKSRSEKLISVIKITPDVIRLEHLIADLLGALSNGNG